MIVYVVTFETNKGWGLRGPVNSWVYLDTRVYIGKEYAKRQAELFCKTRKHKTKFSIVKREVKGQTW